MKRPIAFPTFLFRTPCFSFDALSQFEDRQDSPVFREMIQLGSPDLSNEMERENDSDSSKYAIYRYYQRACTRPTPFGLFAGCSMGVIGEKTAVRLSEEQAYKRVTRLDMNNICGLIQQIEKDQHVCEKLTYYPNTSIYRVGKNLRYVSCHYHKAYRKHQIEQVEDSEYLQQALTKAVGGVSFRELAEALTDDEIRMEEAVEFMHLLIDSQLLVSELEPAITNVEQLDTVIEKLDNINYDNELFVEILKNINRQLSAIDRQPIGTTNAMYTEIIRNIEQTGIETEFKYLFQTDLYKPASSATVSPYIIKDIQQAIAFLNKINLPPIRANLMQFRDQFVKRYEGCEMPLLFVLDNELGLGYAGNTSGDISPLIDDLIIQPNAPSKSPLPDMLQKHLEPLQRKNTVIELTDEDVKNFEEKWDDLPATLSVFCQILQDDENGRCIHIKSVSGSSAANLLGRFCHLDEQILNHTLHITQKEAEENPEVIFAEIVHLPESRIGNILLRPVLRPYEIPYLAKANVPGDCTIGLNDLYLSVKGNRLVLRSGRLNKEIIPRLSTAHNYSSQTNLPVYQFLCDMQSQEGRMGLVFHWGEEADYLPRVKYKNCILSKARWIVSKKEIESFAEMEDHTELMNKVGKWRTERNIPQHVVLADGDNELYIDMENPLSIQSGLWTVKKRPSFILEEFLFDPDKAVVHGEGGVYTNEFIFAFHANVAEGMKMKESHGR